MCEVVEFAISTYYYQSQEEDKAELREAIQEVAAEWPAQTSIVCDDSWATPT